MKNNNYEVDVLINDKPIKKYAFENKIYVEAKPGQTYTIRIKNNSFTRVLAAASVDGLSVLSGKTEEVNTSPGYVINGYNSLKIDGFRISDNEVASFKFDKKDKSYAASKDDNSEQNVGVLGIRIFTEKIKPQTVVTEIHHYQNNDWRWWTEPRYETPVYPTNPIVWGNNTSGETFNMNEAVNSYNASSNASYNCCLNNSNGSIDDCDVSINNSSTGHLEGKIVANNLSTKSPLRGFDLGTSMGSSKESKVVEVEFERGILVDSINIYYASKSALLEMGIPLSSEKQINFPEPFKDEGKYCVPPKNWKK